MININTRDDVSIDPMVTFLTDSKESVITTSKLSQVGKLYDQLGRYDVIQGYKTLNNSPLKRTKNKKLFKYMKLLSKITTFLMLFRNLSKE